MWQTQFQRCVELQVFRLCLILWIGFNLLDFDDVFQCLLLLLHQNFHFRFKNGFSIRLWSTRRFHEFFAKCKLRLTKKLAIGNFGEYWKKKSSKPIHQIKNKDLKFYAPLCSSKFISKTAHNSKWGKNELNLALRNFW